MTMTIDSIEGIEIASNQIGKDRKENGSEQNGSMAVFPLNEETVGHELFCYPYLDSEIFLCSTL